jgi:drug/metabolite transporter (DMT)-like permease
VAAEWLWIPITLWAAFAQTLRNAAQRSLTRALGTLGATLVRFLYGLPFAAAWLGAVAWIGGFELPRASVAFVGWVVGGAVAQILATAALLRVMADRNFALGVAYSKTEILQVALFGFLFLGDPIVAGLALAVACGTAGVLFLAPATDRGWRALLEGWTSRTALLGLASGAAFALSAVGYRGAALALPGTPFPMAAAFSLLVAQSVQTLLLGGWLLVRDPGVVVRVLRAWQTSLFAGFMGAAASAGWFSAMAIEPAAHVRTLGLIELLFSAVVSRRIFRERSTRRELAGMLLLGAAVLLVTLSR